MDLVNNKGEKISYSRIISSRDKTISIQKIGKITTVNVRDRITGEVKSETFLGDSRFGE